MMVLGPTKMIDDVSPVKIHNFLNRYLSYCFRFYLLIEIVDPDQYEFQLTWRQQK